MIPCDIALAGVSEMVVTVNIYWGCKSRGRSLCEDDGSEAGSSGQNKGATLNRSTGSDGHGSLGSGNGSGVRVARDDSSSGGSSRGGSVGDGLVDDSRHAGGGGDGKDRCRGAAAALNSLGDGDGNALDRLGRRQSGRVRSRSSTVTAGEHLDGRSGGGHNGVRGARDDSGSGRAVGNLGSAGGDGEVLGGVNSAAGHGGAEEESGSSGETHFDGFEVCTFGTANTGIKRRARKKSDVKLKS